MLDLSQHIMVLYLLASKVPLVSKQECHRDLRCGHPFPEQNCMSAFRMSQIYISYIYYICKSSEKTQIHTCLLAVSSTILKHAFPICKPRTFHIIAIESSELSKLLMTLSTYTALHLLIESQTPKVLPVEAYWAIQNYCFLGWTCSVQHIGQLEITKSIPDMSHHIQSSQVSVN